MLTCVFENGNRGQLRHVVTGVVLLDAAGKNILLVKRAPHLTCPNLWALPGGYLDQGETVSQGARREAREETGHEVKILYLLQVIDNPIRRKEDRQNVEFTFVARAIRPVALPDREISTVRWFDLQHIPTETEFAFDHRSSVMLYRRYCRHSFSLPVFTSR